MAQVQNTQQTLKNSSSSGDSFADSLNARELGAKLVYGILTLLILWSAGDASGDIFWSRQPVVFVVSLLSVGLWIFFTNKPLLKKILRKPSVDELRSSLARAAMAIAVSAVISFVLVKVFQESPWVSWSFLESFNVFHHIDALPFVILSSFVVEFFLRAHLSPSWGRANVAFLESVTIAVALQHFLPIVLLLPMIFFLEKTVQSKGIWTAALTRLFWTLGVVMGLGLLA